MNGSSGPEFDTPTVSDALDRLGIGGQARGLRALAPGLRCQGPAYTVRLVPANGRDGTVGDFIDDVDPGSVVVLDNGGRLDATVWGDLLTATAVRRGLAGTVVHGVCRDSPATLEARYPMFSRGTFMRTGKDRVVAVETQGIVSLGHASVGPGDLIVADADGVVVVPERHRSAVLEVAREIADVEVAMRRAIAEGTRLRDARNAAGYHRLQRGGGAGSGRGAG